MSRREILSPSCAAMIKKAVLLLVLAAAGYGVYLYLLARRPALPERSAELQAFAYLTALRNRDYQTAYAFASTEARAKITPTEMANACNEVYAQIDGWQFGRPRYSITHLSASVPVVIYYRPSWAPETPQTMKGKLNFRLEDGSWRLIVALPFVTAIMKQRDEQHFGG